MAKLTITVNDEALRKARMRALAQGTSVNALLRDFLESYAGVRGEQTAAVRSLLALSRSAGARRGTARWSRDELHEHT